MTIVSRTFALLGEGQEKRNVHVIATFRLESVEPRFAQSAHIDPNLHAELQLCAYLSMTAQRVLGLKFRG